MTSKTAPKSPIVRVADRIDVVALGLEDEPCNSLAKRASRGGTGGAVPEDEEEVPILDDGSNRAEGLPPVLEAGVGVAANRLIVEGPDGPTLRASIDGRLCRGVTGAAMDEEDLLDEPGSGVVERATDEVEARRLLMDLRGPMEARGRGRRGPSLL